MITSLASAGEDGFESLPDDTELRRAWETTGSKFPSSAQELAKWTKTPPVIFPSSRSLQKKNADFQDPRIVYALNERLFIGIAPKTNQAEIISYNYETKEFDFLVVKNFFGKEKRVIEKPPRTQCMSCHQSGGPIFPRSPWKETTITGPVETSSGEKIPASELYTRTVKALGSEKLYGMDLSYFDGAGGLNSSFIDRKVREAQELAQKANVCSQICGGDIRCKSYLIQAALRIDLLTLDEKNEFFLKVDANWPPNGFAYPSSVIPDRNPIDNNFLRLFASSPKKMKLIASQSSDVSAAQTKAIIKILDEPTAINKFGTEVTYEESTSPLGNGFPFRCAVAPGSSGTPGCPKGQELITEIKYELKPGSMGDPLTPRPLVGGIPKTKAREYSADLLSTYRGCIGFNALDSEIVSKYSVAELKKAFEAPAIKDLLREQWPVGRATFIMRLLKALGATTIPECYKASEATKIAPTQLTFLEKVVDRLTAPLSSSKQSPNLFLKYCSQCHGNSGSATSLPLDSSTALKAFGGVKASSVFERIKNKTMPPPNALLQPTQAEREQMLQQLQK